MYCDGQLLPALGEHPVEPWRALAAMLPLGQWGHDYCSLGDGR
jgi:hypothetical protein